MKPLHPPGHKNKNADPLEKIGAQDKNNNNTQAEHSTASDFLAGILALRTLGTAFGGGAWKD